MGDRATASKLYNQGVVSAGDKSSPSYLQHAFQMFCSAMNADPEWATACYQAGNNASDLNHFHAAVACWRRALECEMPDITPMESQDASRAKVLCNLGWRLESLGATEEALKITLEACRVDPALAFSWCNLGIIQGRMGQLEESVKSARKAFKLNPEHAVIEMAYAFALLFNRNLADGFKHFESRWQYKLKNFLHYPYPRWEGEPGKTLFLVSDQGLGDTLSMCRFLRKTCERSQYVHASVHPELLRLLQYALIDVQNLNLLPQPCNFPAADAWTTFVSLPFALGLTDDEIRNQPQIKFDAPRTNAKAWKVEGRKLHIGICWRGSALNETNEQRSVPVTQFLDLYRVPGIQLYSLQVDSNRQQMHDMGCAPVIKDLAGYIRDASDTCAILKDLDLVIGIDSALGHICSLARKEYWCAYAYLARDYRIGFDGTDQLWSNYKVFLQEPDMSWQKVFDRMVEALRERVK